MVVVFGGWWWWGEWWGLGGFGGGVDGGLHFGDGFGVRVRVWGFGVQVRSRAGTWERGCGYEESHVFFGLWLFLWHGGRVFCLLPCSRDVKVKEGEIFFILWCFFFLGASCILVIWREWDF